MGFKTPDLSTAYAAIRNMAIEIKSPYNDGFTVVGCKQELYQLKCWLEDEYNSLPTFDEEKQWEQERLVQILKKP